MHIRKIFRIILGRIFLLPYNICNKIFFSKYFIHCLFEITVLIIVN